jgi:hypothetical protein
MALRYNLTATLSYFTKELGNSSNNVFHTLTVRYAFLLFLMRPNVPWSGNMVTQVQVTPSTDLHSSQHEGEQVSNWSSILLQF